MAVVPLKAGDRHPAGPAGASSSPDPATGLRFVVKIGSREIGSFTECTGLSVEYEVFEWAEGGQNAFVHKLRGRAKYPNIVLKRGLTYQDALIKWFNECADKTQREPLIIELLSGDISTPVRKWAFDGAFPIKWTGPTLNTGQAAAAVETIEIVHQGFSSGA